MRWEKSENGRRGRAERDGREPRGRGDGRCLFGPSREGESQVGARAGTREQSLFAGSTELDGRASGQEMPIRRNRRTGSRRDACSSSCPSLTRRDGSMTGMKRAREAKGSARPAGLLGRVSLSPWAATRARARRARLNRSRKDRGLREGRSKDVPMLGGDCEVKSTRCTGGVGSGGDTDESDGRRRSGVRPRH